MKSYFKDRFLNKVMIITGAARGIGAATARRAAAEGAKIVMTDILAEEGQDTLSSILAEGGDAMFLPLDISIESNAQKMVEQALLHYGKIDIAINNAGVMGSPSPLDKLPAKDMDFTMKNNFYSVFFCCKYELSQMVNAGTGGVIINNASIAGLTGLPGNPAYVASKHAVNGLTKNLALDYAKYGIRVNSVNPAGTRTPMTEEAYHYVLKQMEAAKAAGNPPNELSSMSGQKTKTILGHDAEPEEQAASILFLASEDATHMTGATLQTDGGWTCF